ncbi:MULTISPECIES: hypothetical protein [Streptomyces]|uniref:Uncharacterized protein n=1 Tax=Streptomyces chilikensis TaxID=1194079 RepID=A0ABV3EP56_9ACTN|nr:hypothetical protein [Streptomyces sp. MJP52]MDH6227652.1 hypothetical protein [Streptomyces sp. MJP52]
MSRRVSLPGADELFRTTGGSGLQSSSPRRQAATERAEARVPAPATEDDPAVARDGAEGLPPSVPAQAGDAQAAEHAVADAAAGEPGETHSRAGGTDGAAAAATGVTPRRRGRPARRPSGRERHDEKITVYVSAEELMDLEHARLVLRGEHGLAVDRGRIVREAVAVVLADLESRGDASILVRRLRGR